jgi:hypothetical protein
MKRILATLSLIFASVAIFAGTTIFVPTLLAPDDEAEYQMADVLLDWEAVAGSTAIYYEVQIDTDNTFPNPQSFDVELSAMNAPALHFGVTYFWRVRAIDGGEKSDWSEVWSFTTLDAFELDRPRDGSDEIDPNERLEWKGKSSRIDLSGFEYFEIQLDTSENFNSASPYHIVYFEEAAPLYDDDEGKLDSHDLLFGETFFWRVRGMHEGDTMEWSEVFSFEVIPFTELKDPDDEEFVDPLVNFRWDAINGVDHYLFQISEDPEFASVPTITLSDREYDSDTLEFGTTYYWRVALSHDLDISEYTEPWSINVFGAPVLDAPSDGSTNIVTRPELKWDAMAGPTAFTIQLSYNDPSFNNAQTITVENGNNTSVEKYQLTSEIDSATTVYWRVRALINDEQISDWSEEWMFTIAGTGIEEAENAANLQVYPNPSNGDFTVTFDKAEGENVELQVIDMVGKVVYEETLNFANGTTQQINTALPEGVYILKLHKGEETYTDKITIR